MKLSVVILNYKVPYYLLLCLDSVKKATADISSEIIVVDNKSEDESFDLVSKYFPDVIFIQNKENQGFSKGNNLGVAKAKGEFLCILNPDTVVSENCFTKLINFYKNTENAGAIGTKLIDGAGHFLPESKRCVPTPKVALEKLVGISKNYYNHNVEDNKNGETDILVGAFMFLKTSIYKEVKGFDEDFYMYGEDIDLSYRILKAGYQNYYFGEIQNIHFKGESTNKDDVYLQRFFDAMYIFYQKHFQNSLQNSLVKLGLKFAKTVNKFSSESFRTEAIPENYILFSKNEKLKKSIEAQLQQAIQMKVDLNEKYSNSYLIFDAETLSYKDIILSIQKLKNARNIFRIRPSFCNFILGSENSKAKGEVLKFDL
ncbi:MAG: glycosyltransferase family 2 protein [Psychroflexus sp.]